MLDTVRFSSKTLKIQWLISALIGWIFSPLSAQVGCTDPQASNYDPGAVVNNGSCIYPTTNYTLNPIVTLPNNLEEASGAAWALDNLWVHEDAGNEDRVYQVDTLTGATTQLVTISQAENFDWEDLATDDDYLYIGDFGNNTGNRTNLRIYKIAQSDLEGNIASAELIEFSFSDQTDFTPNPNANNFDCEAFFVWNDSLHLFSKNWVDFKTRHYTLPTAPGEYVAQVQDSMSVEAQITGADINEDGVVVLLGYNVNSGANLFWLLYDYPNTRFFKGNRRKISLGSAISNSQTEGVVFKNQYEGYVVSEKFSLLPQRLLSFDLQSFLDNAVSETSIDLMVSGLSVFPNPFREYLYVDVPNDYNGMATMTLTDMTGRVCFIEKKELLESNEIQLDLNDVLSGVYLLRVETEVGIFVKMVFKR